jgi:hypothetical protein
MCFDCGKMGWRTYLCLLHAPLLSFAMMSMHREINGRIHGLPKVPFPQDFPFNIAVITAGELRSFAYVEKSWERYFLNDWKSHIKIFGHLIHIPSCPLSSFAFRKFTKLATDYEYFSSTSLLSPTETLSRLPSCLTTPEYRPRWVKRFQTNGRGNFIDMTSRRKRAYELARAYGITHQIQWDLIFFLRLDTAFYDPPLDLYSIYSLLKKSEEPTETTGSGRNPAIFIPGSCNFGGMCDRLAFGLPETMDVYFETDWPLKVMAMSCAPAEETAYLLPQLAQGKYEGFVPELDTIRKMKEDLTVHVPSSETMLSLWAVMNNITQLNYDKDIAFATLRVEHAVGYCSLTRRDYIHHYPNQTQFIWDPDKHSMYDLTSPFKGLDLVASREERCGNRTQHLDLEKICATYPSCSCLKNFGHLYMGV